MPSSCAFSRCHVGVCHVAVADDDDEYTDLHRLLLQHFWARPLMTENQLAQVFAKARDTILAGKMVRGAAAGARGKKRMRGGDGDDDEDDEDDDDDEEDDDDDDDGGGGDDDDDSGVVRSGD